MVKIVKPIKTVKHTNERGGCGGWGELKILQHIAKITDLLTGLIGSLDLALEGMEGLVSITKDFEKRINRLETQMPKQQPRAYVYNAKDTTNTRDTSGGSNAKY
jgi:hypothetical protein